MRRTPRKSPPGRGPEKPETFYTARGITSQNKEQPKMKDTSCQDIELFLQDYLDGSLLPSQREVLEEHVRSCPSCSLLLTDLRRLDGEFLDLPEVIEPADLGRRILSAVPAAEKFSRRPIWSSHPVGLALAAMAVIVMGFLVGARYGTLVGGGEREIEVAFFAPSATSVAVVGDFNEWDPLRDRMERGGDEGVWRVRLKVRPGVYEYGFLVDGRDWTKDPKAEESLADGFGGENSVLFVEG